MTVFCKFCGGDVAQNGGGYRCISCGATYRNEEELMPPKPTPPSPPAPTERHGADVFEQNIGGVLEFYCSDGKMGWSGSGFLITEDGFAITNAHVAAKSDGSPADMIQVRLCGKTVRATVLMLGDHRAGRGNGIDLALVKLSSLPQGATPTTFGDSDQVKNGETVYIIGNPRGEGTCITKGIISDNRRMIGNRRFLMTDGAVNGGNSGGPMFNEKGEVIGVITLGSPNSEGMNYAIPSRDVLRFLES